MMIHFYHLITLMKNEFLLKKVQANVE